MFQDTLVPIANEISYVISIRLVRLLRPKRHIADTASKFDDTLGRGRTRTLPPFRVSSRKGIDSETADALNRSMGAPVRKHGESYSRFQVDDSHMTNSSFLPRLGLSAFKFLLNPAHGLLN